MRIILASGLDWLLPILAGTGITEIGLIIICVSLLLYFSITVIDRSRYQLSTGLIAFYSG